MTKGKSTTNFLSLDSQIQYSKPIHSIIEYWLQRGKTDKIREIKEASINRSTYEIRTDMPDEIIHLSEEINYDILLSDSINSCIRIIGTVMKRVIDSIRKPVPLLHE
jgi:hypothetical protein